jgi:hypothetical protein
MGAIAFSKTRVIGLQNWIIDCFIDFCIQEVGEKPYLVEAKFNMDNAYNAFGFEDDASPDNMLEFYGLMSKYATNREYEKLNVSEHWKQRFAKFMPQLLNMIEEVARDNWGISLGGTGKELPDA